VSPKTKEAVLALAEQIDYQPNRLALSFQQNQTHTIGVLVPNLDYVTSSMIRGIDEAALEAGYTVMVCQSNESFGREIVNTKRLMDSLVDGFLVCVSSETKIFDHIKKIIDKRLPTVVFDRICPDLAAPRVIIDNADGGFQATEHLIQQGYKRIAVLAGPKNLTISNLRLEGYISALKKHGRRFDPELLVHCDFDQRYAYNATLNLLSKKQRPDAIFAISDRMIIGAMLAVKEKGLKVPKKLVWSVSTMNLS
jgi:LacI family transcriptional regulator